MKKVLTSINLAITVLIFVFLNSCNSDKKVPFPENASGYKVPVTKSFEFPEATPIDWHTVSKDSVPVANIHSFDLDKLSSKPFVINTFKPEKEPPETIPLNWSQLDQKPFSLDTAETRTLRMKTFLLPKPVITKASPPSQFPRSTSGFLQMGVEEGLPSNYIYATAIDHNGLVWISTETGLVCYKGEFFETYNFIPNLPNNNADFVWNMVFDEANNLFMVTGSGQLYTLNTDLGIVQHLEGETVIARIAPDNKGKLWFTGYENGLGVIDFKTKTIRRFRFPELSKENDVFIGVRKDSENNIWFGSAQEVYVLNADQNAYRIVGEKDGLKVTTVFEFYETKSGDIWISSFNNGSWSISADKKSIRVINQKQGYSGRAMAVCEDLEGKMWIADTDTIFIHDPAKHTYRKIPTGMSMFANRVPGNSLRDFNGNIWFGTPQNKILLFDPAGALPEHLDMNDGLISNDVWGALEDNEGLIWLGTYNGINIYDPVKNKLMQVNMENGLTHNRRFQVNLLDDGRVLVAGNMGFTIFDKKNKRLTEYSSPQFFVSVTERNDGTFWFGSTDGLYVFNPKKQTLKGVTQYKNTPISRVWNYIEDKGKIWAITMSGSGAYVIDPQQDNILLFGAETGMNVSNISAIHKTKSGEIWIGGNPGFSVINTDQHTVTNITSEQGLYPETMYDMAELNGRMYLGSQDGIVVVEPPKPTDNVKRWHFYNYGKRDGYPLNDYNQKASTTTRNGQIWWGVTPQITIMTQEPKIDSQKPRVFVSGISIMAQESEFYEKDARERIFADVDTLWNSTQTGFEVQGTAVSDSGYYESHHIEWDSISGPFHLPLGLKLPFDQNSVTFSFSNPDVRGRDKIVYRYVLEGIDEDWSRVTSESVSKNYYNLKNGQYTFKVATRGFNGEWSEPAAFEFTILPPWWLTPPAYLLYLAIFVGIIFIIDKIQRRRIVNRERERAREKELEQAKEIEKAYNRLKETQTQLIQAEKMASLGELTAGIAHEIQNPLNFVNNFSEVNKELIAEMKEEIENNNLEEVKAIAKDIDDNEGKIIYHGKRADAIVKSMLLHSRGSSRQKELTDMNALADEYLRLSYHGLRAKDKSFNADFKMDADPDLPKINVVPQDIGRVLINLINNAFYAVYEKTKQKTEGYKPMVVVTTVNSKNFIEIRVKDNGDGIPDHLKEKIFQPFFTTKPTGQGTGLGLSLSYDIIKAHGGELRVETKDGEGTEFIITLNP